MKLLAATLNRHCAACPCNPAFKTRDYPHTRVMTALALVIAITTQAHSQQAVADNLIPGDADLPYEDLYENIAQLTVNKMNLNTVSTEALLSLGILSQKHVDAIINYRNTNGEFIDIYELQSVPSLDLETIQSLVPYVTIRSSKLRGNVNTYFFHTL
ncbi:MAG: helix-hairpin-helix domain-containing protein [Bacteroidota bacterium]